MTEPLDSSCGPENERWTVALNEGEQLISADAMTDAKTEGEQLISADAMAVAMAEIEELVNGDKLPRNEGKDWENGCGNWSNPKTPFLMNISAVKIGEFLEGFLEVIDTQDDDGML